MKAQSIVTGEKKSSTRTRRKAFDIPGFHESVKKEFEAGEITLEEAAIEFCRGGWTPYINIEYTKKKLGI